MKRHSVAVRQAEATLSVAEDQTILDAALKAGIDYPHSCGMGRCGACKSRLLDGSVDMLPHTKFALSADEKAAGYVLACRAQPRSAVAIAWLGQEMGAGHDVVTVDAIVAAKERLTHNITRLVLSVPKTSLFVFSPGQYAKLTFAGQPPRNYSMANQPGLGVVEFHIRREAGGQVSGYCADHVSVGDGVRVTGPFGNAYLREAHTGSILAVAGGSGLAPIKSIVERAIVVGARQPIYLYFSVREEQDLYFDEYFETLAALHTNLHFRPIVTRLKGASTRRLYATSRADCVIMSDWPAGISRAKAYLAGSPGLVETVTTLLKTQGMSEEDIHADAFYFEASSAPPEINRAAVNEQQ